MTISIIFLWLSKILSLYSGLDYIIDDAIADPLTITSWILLRISSYRFTFIFIVIAIYLSYVLKVNLFEKGYNKVLRIIIIIYGVITTFYLLIVYVKGQMILELIAFIFVSLYMFVIYFPFMISCYSASKTTEVVVYKKAFISLAIMALCFILILINQLIDRIFIVVLSIQGYTPFYFAGLICTIIGIIGAYFGFIKPKAKD